MQHFFASLQPVKWMSILVSVAVTLLFCWLICFGFKNRSTSIIAGTINLISHRWPGKFHSTQIEFWEETNTFYENARFVDLFIYLGSSSTRYCVKALVSAPQLHFLRHELPIVVKKGKKNNIAVMQLAAWEAE